MGQIIRDKQGCQYQQIVHEDEQGIFIRLIELSRHRKKVGEIKCVFFPPSELKICDLYINNGKEDMEELLTSDWQKILQKIFKIKPTNYRQRGLGTHLLQLVISFALLRGMKRVYGKLVEKDVEENPNLADWYKKHGFQVEPLTSDSKSNVVASIWKDLD